MNNSWVAGNSRVESPHDGLLPKMSSSPERPSEKPEPQVPSSYHTISCSISQPIRGLSCVLRFCQHFSTAYHAIFFWLISYPPESYWLPLTSERCENHLSEIIIRRVAIVKKIKRLLLVVDSNWSSEIKKRLFVSCNKIIVFLVAGFGFDIEDVEAERQLRVSVMRRRNASMRQQTGGKKKTNVDVPRFKVHTERPMVCR